MENCIYLVEGTITSKDKSRSSEFSRAYADGSEAFEMLHEFIKSNYKDSETKWQFDFKFPRHSDEVIVIGEGKFYIHRDDKQREEGTAVISLKKVSFKNVDLIKSGKEKEANKIYRDCLFGDDESHDCSSCSHRFTCKEYAKILQKKCESGELGEIGKKFSEIYKKLWGDL